MAQFGAVGFSAGRQKVVFVVRSPVIQRWYFEAEFSTEGGSVLHKLAALNVEFLTREAGASIKPGWSEDEPQGK
jgi:hypothetical protein